MRNIGVVRWLQGSEQGGGYLQEDGAAAVEEKVDIVEGGIESLGVGGWQRRGQIAIHVHQEAPAAVRVRRHCHLRAHAGT